MIQPMFWTKPSFAIRLGLSMVILILFFLSGCNWQMGEESVRQLLEEARKEYAPDQRTKVWSVRARWEKGKLLLTGEIHNEALKDKLIKLLKKRGVTPIQDQLTTLPNPELGPKTIAIANASVINLRRQPDHTAELATQALLGTPMHILDKRKGWYQVQMPNGYLGWTDDFIALNTPLKFKEWVALPKIIVTSLYSTTFVEEKKTREMVGDVVMGGILALEGEAGSRYKVRYPNGRGALLEKKEARPLAEWLKDLSASPDSIEATAHQMLGIPYLWGGNSSKGMDSSGFTQLVFFMNGLQIPRDADQQAQIGVPVNGGAELDSFEKGVLLFFGSSEKDGQPAKVTHVAISLGKGLYIQASQDIHINSLVSGTYDFSQSRRKAFLFARKILGTSSGQGFTPLAQIPYFQGRYDESSEEDDDQK